MEFAIRAGSLGGADAFAKRLGWKVERLGALLRRWASEEERRFILFAPCLMAAGVLAWFSLDEQPGPLTTGLFALAAFGGWMLAAWLRRDGVRLACRALFAFAAGMALIALRTALVDAPVVPAGMAAVTVTGVLDEVELRERDRRYTIRVESVTGLSATESPRRVRVVWRGPPGEAAAGDRVAVRASLAPPPGPVLPGGYDFARGLFYEGIGGTGFAYEPPRILDRSGESFRRRIERLREAVADRVEHRIGGPAGAVAAALMTGKRERIPESDVEHLRDSGLAHLLAISGLHMGLVCGFLFWSSRRLLAESESLALRLPIKKMAAMFALAGGVFYLALSGGAWSAQRAFIMAAIVFGAILFDRRGISLRNAALAAIVIISLRPEAVLSPGFQMSFAAVITLIAAFTFIEERWPAEGGRGLLGRAAAFLGGLALTSLLAGLATGPFAAHHFGRIASYGLLGNLLAMPVITLAVMPAMVLSMFLMPIGLDGPVLVLVGAGIDLVLGVAAWTASRPGAVALVPMLAPAGILAATGGLLALALLKAPWRLAGAGLIVLAFPLSLGVPQPDVFVSRDMRNVGIRIADGDKALALLSKRRDRFTVEGWLQALAKPPDVGAQDTIAGCRDGPCFAKTANGHRVAIIETRASLRQACERADIVILRARSMPGDGTSCGRLLLSLDEDGTHPATTIRHDGGWIVSRTR